MLKILQHPLLMEAITDAKIDPETVTSVEVDWNAQHQDSAQGKGIIVRVKVQPKVEHIWISMKVADE